MNMSKPISRSLAAADEPVRILVTSRSRSGVQAIVNQLCVSGFCDHAEWSKILQKTNTKEFMSIMTRSP